MSTRAKRARNPAPPASVELSGPTLFTSFELTPESKRKAVDAAIKSHIVDEATLMGMYPKRGGKR